MIELPLKVHIKAKAIIVNFMLVRVPTAGEALGRKLFVVTVDRRYPLMRRKRFTPSASTSTFIL